MAALDPRTVERIAALVVDDGGPYERKGWQLARFLAHSGWSDPPEYDGSPRIAWLTDQIHDRVDDQVAVEKLLCRVCDPVEYDEGLPAAEQFQRALNETLESERLVVSFVGGRPVLGELAADGAGPQFSEPPELERRISALLEDDRTARVLNRRVVETRICERGGAHTMAIISIGSVVEGLLLALLTERDADARDHRFVGRDGQVIRNKQPTLEMLIDTAYARGWIQLDAKTFMHQVRDFRNYIHPRKEFADEPDFDADSVRLCWTPVQSMLNDLESRLRP